MDELHKKAKEGFFIARRKDPSTDRLGYMPFRTKSKRPIYVDMGEPHWYPTKQEAIDATYEYE